MSNPYAPLESPDLVWMERAVLIGDAMSLIAYGVTFTLFILCSYTLITQRSNRSSIRAWGLAAYITVMFGLSTTFIGMNTRSLQMGLIDNRNYPGGPIVYWTRGYSLPLTVIPNACSIISSWLADALLLYRCYVIFNSRRYFLALPSLLYLGSLTMGIMLLFQASRPEANLWTKVTINFGLPYFVITISLNVIITMMISARLLLYRHRMSVAFPDGNSAAAPYGSIITMLVESSALYAVFSLLFIGPYAAKSHISNIFLPILSQVQIIAPFLIILRVANRRAWTSDTATYPMTSMHFGTESHPQTASTAGNSNVGANGLKITFNHSEKDTLDPKNASHDDFIHSMHSGASAV